jgi:hypothetical protein
MKRIEKIAIERGYFVTEEGLCYSKRGNQVGYINNGYYKVAIKIKGRNKKFSIHRIQAYQKYGDKIFEAGIQVRHLNGNPLDNSWENIAIGNQSENQMDIPEQIRIKRALIATSKVRKHKHKEIIDYYNKVKSYNKTMKKFNISSKGTLHFIINKSYSLKN